MPISRLQIPQQVDVFATGGVLTPSNDQFSQLGAMMTDRFQPFEQNVQKYQQRLAPYVYQAPRMNIYDLASELGAGLLSTPNTGGASAFTGLGVGFTRASDRMRRREEDNAKARQQLGLQAAQLAMQDEQKANEFLNEITLKMIGDTNKEIKTMNLSWLDETSGKRIDRTLDKASPLFKKLMSDPKKYGVKEITQPLIDMSGANDQYEALNKNTAGLITSQEEDWSKDADAQVGISDKTNSARYYANQLSEEDFGPMAVYTLGAKSILLQLGFDGFIDEEALGTQFAVNSVGTGLAMGLIGQTKGAISDREMKMFMKASATLGNSKQGFLKILDITDKIAKRSIALNALWAEKRAELMEQKVSLAKIRAAQSRFKADYHKAHPMFVGGNEYNPDLSIKDNLSNMTKGTEAYNLVAQMTEEGEALYNSMSQKHATFGRPSIISNQSSGLVSGPTKNNWRGLPDGSMFVGYGKDKKTPLYRDLDGKLWRPE